METLITKALERVEAHKETIGEPACTQITEQLNWIKSNYLTINSDTVLPDFNLGVICARSIDDLDPQLSEIIRRILSKIGFYENGK